MRTELFGVFGDRSAFRRYRPPSGFDQVLEGGSVTVGVRDVGLGIPNRTTTYADPTATCIVWGESYPPGQVANAARWLLERYGEIGMDAFSELNGSYLAVVDADGEAIVATDPIRSWECFYADAGRRVFGTNPTTVSRTLERPRTASNGYRLVARVRTPRQDLR